jgi:perosamine synthetase
MQPPNIEFVNHGGRQVKPNIALTGGTPVRITPWPRWPVFTDKDAADLADALNDGRVSGNTSPKIEEFERRYAERFGVKFALTTSTGVAALHLAMVALEIGPGDEVIVPAHTFIGTTVPVVLSNAIPVFVDVTLSSFNIDVKAIESAVSERTRAIVAVHLNGLPADMTEVRQIADKCGLFVIEDACQAHGATYKGKSVGSLGDVAGFSFYEDKVLTTGEGGMLLTDDSEMYERARSFRTYGEDKFLSIAERRYEHHRLGSNYRMSALNAVLGINQLERLEDMVEARNRNARFLHSELARIPGIISPQEFSDRTSAYYKYVCRIDAEVIGTDVQTFIEALKAEGIPASTRYPTPLPLQKVYRDRVGYGRTGCPYDCNRNTPEVDYTRGSWPISEKIGREAFVLLIHPSVEQSDLRDAVEAIGRLSEYYRNSRRNAGG